MQKLLLLLLFLPVLLAGQYRMEVSKTVSRREGAGYQQVTASVLDFNNDGIDDLVIPLEGKYSINFYFGRETGFGDTLDYELEGIRKFNEPGLHTINCGDMNGDGIEDLLYRWSYTPYLADGVTWDWDNQQNQARIIFGNTQNNFEANVIIAQDSVSRNHAPDPGEYSLLYKAHLASKYYPLGDVNGDGYDDIGCVNVLAKRGTQSQPVEQLWARSEIVFGGVPGGPNSFKRVHFRKFDCIYPKGHTQNPTICGVGDVNNDGYDDFYVSHEIENLYNAHSADAHRLTLYYGNANLNQPYAECDSLHINPLVPTDDEGFAWLGLAMYPIGDYNSDGLDDFIGYIALHGVPTNGAAIFYGANNTNPSASGLVLEYAFADELALPYSCIRAGDINGDGISDIVYGKPMKYGYCVGGFWVYLGGEGDAYYDAYGVKPEDRVDERIGDKVIIGDFNGDGCDDIICGPASQDFISYRLSVFYIFNGSPNITTNAQSNTSPAPKFSFKAYPNPFNPNVKFSINAKNIKNLSLNIYNVKGQKVKAIKVNSKNVTWQAKNNASGVYFAKLIKNNKVVCTKKITLIK